MAKGKLKIREKKAARKATRKAAKKRLIARKRPAAAKRPAAPKRPRRANARKKTQPRATVKRATRPSRARAARLVGVALAPAAAQAGPARKRAKHRAPKPLLRVTRETLRDIQAIACVRKCFQK